MATTSECSLDPTILELVHHRLCIFANKPRPVGRLDYVEVLCGSRRQWLGEFIAGNPCADDWDRVLSGEPGEVRENLTEHGLAIGTLNIATAVMGAHSRDNDDCCVVTEFALQSLDQPHVLIWGEATSDTNTVEDSATRRKLDEALCPAITSAPDLDP